MLHDKENFIKLQNVETLQTIHTDQNAINLEMKSAIKYKNRLPTQKKFFNFIKQLIEKVKKIETEIIKLLNNVKIKKLYVTESVGYI